MKLQEGQITHTKIASWFGVHRDTYYTHKQEYLEELKHYADYEIQGRKVFITKVYEPTYIKIDKGVDKYMLMGSVINNKDSFSSGANISRKLKGTQEYGKLQLDTVARRMNHVKQEDFVERSEFHLPTFTEKNQQPDYFGYWEYKWCVKEENDVYREMTQEEYEYFVELLAGVYNPDGDYKTLQKTLITLIRYNIDHIKTDEAMERLLKQFKIDNFYFSIIAPMKSKFGIQLVHGTKYYDLNGEPFTRESLKLLPKEIQDGMGTILHDKITGEPLLIDEIFS